MNVRNGRGDDERFLVQMLRAESNALGFVPRSRLQWDLERGRILVAHEGRMRLGFLRAGSPASGVVPIFQLLTEEGVRRREIALAMVGALEGRALGAGAWGLEARCRDDLEANAFWPAAGFGMVETCFGGAGRRRMVNVYGRRIWGSGRSF